MHASVSPPPPLSALVGSFRWAFMPLGLFALVAVGVHAAADRVDDLLLRQVESLDAWLDGLLARAAATAAWVHRVDSRERTLFARGLALAWELAVDAVVALPMLGYQERDPRARGAPLAGDTWAAVLGRARRQPTPMRLLRPALTALFALGGAAAAARLLEASLFALLSAEGALAAGAAVGARLAGGLGLVLVLASLGWRAVLRALQHADAACVASVQPWARGWWGTALTLPLAAAAGLELGALASLVR